MSLPSDQEYRDAPPHYNISDDEVPVLESPPTEQVSPGNQTPSSPEHTVSTPSSLDSTSTSNDSATFQIIQSTNSSVIPTNSLSTTIVPAATSTLQSNTHPHIPVTVMSQPAVNLTGIAHMPVRGSRSAPRTFKGKYTQVERFLTHYNNLLTRYNINNEGEKCRTILEYCSESVSDFIKTLEHYKTPNWIGLENQIKLYYDADRKQTRYRPIDLVNFVKRSQLRSCNTLSQWKKYFRQYAIIAGFLLAKQRLSDNDYAGYFWVGIPKDVRTVLEGKLLIKEPNHNISDPWTVKQICDAAEQYFKRDKFSDMLLHAELFAIENTDFTGSDTDSDTESDTDSESDNDSRHPRRKHKHVKRNKYKTHAEKLKKAENTVPTPAELERTHKYQGTSGEIENMIQQLNTMSLDDPHYGHLYYKVLSLDKTGIAQKCIYREPPHLSQRYMSNNRQAPPHMSQTSPLTYPNNIPIQAPRIPPRNRDNHNLNVERPPFNPPSNQCYGCFEQGHMLHECPKMADLSQRGVIMQDPSTRKYRMANGQSIYRRQGESIVDAVQRALALAPQSHLMTVNDEVNSFYNHEAYDSDHSDTDSDTDSYDDGPYWKYAHHAQRQLYRPESANERQYEGTYNSFPATRSEKQTTEARKEATRTPRKVLDGVYPPARKPMRPHSTEKAEHAKPKGVPPGIRFPVATKENVPPVPQEIRPIDARNVRFPEDKDIEMAGPEKMPTRKPISHAETKPKPAANQSHISNSKDSVDRNKVLRQSEISSQVDTRSVVQEILDTEIALPLRKILGSSKELSSTLQDVIRSKNTKPITTTGANVHFQESNQYDVLIKLNMTYRGQPIQAIIDTGSQINVIRDDVARKYLQLPIDVSRKLQMKDANGGFGMLDGVATDVPLSCGSIVTQADLYIGSKVPFELLLGRPWQRGNYVSIDERTDGTHLIFKDINSHEPKYEIFVTPDQLTSRQAVAESHLTKYAFSIGTDNILSPNVQTKTPHGNITDAPDSLGIEATCTCTSEACLDSPKETNKPAPQCGEQCKHKNNGEDVHREKSHCVMTIDGDKTKNNGLSNTDLSGRNVSPLFAIKDKQCKVQPDTQRKLVRHETMLFPGQEIDGNYEHSDGSISRMIDGHVFTLPPDRARAFKMCMAKKCEIKQERAEQEEYKSRKEILQQTHFNPHLQPHQSSTMSTEPPLIPSYTLNHPVTQQQLKTASCTLTSPNGVVTDICQDPDTPSQLFARIIFPTSTLTGYNAGILRSVQGRSYTCFHFDLDDPRMREFVTWLMPEINYDEMLEHVCTSGHMPGIFQRQFPIVPNVPPVPPPTPVDKNQIQAPLQRAGTPFPTSGTINGSQTPLQRRSLPPQSVTSLHSILKPLPIPPSQIRQDILPETFQYPSLFYIATKDDDSSSNKENIPPSKLRAFLYPPETKLPPGVAQKLVPIRFPSLTFAEFNTPLTKEEEIFCEKLSSLSGQDSITDGVIVPEFLTKGQYTQVSTDGKVIIRLPEAEKLLTRFWAGNKPHKNRPSTPESLPDAVPNSSTISSTSTDLSSYELLYPPSPTPFPNIELPEIQEHPEDAVKQPNSVKSNLSETPKNANNNLPMTDLEAKFEEHVHITKDRTTPDTILKPLNLPTPPPPHGRLDPRYFEGAMEAWYPTLLRMTYRLVSSLEHLASTQFGARFAPRRAVQWHTIVAADKFKDYFPEFINTKALERHLGAGSRNRVPHHNRWISHLAKLIRARQDICELMEAYEDWLQTCGLFGGLKEYYQVNRFNATITFETNQLLHNFESEYFLILQYLLWTNNCIDLASSITRLLHMSFPEGEDLNRVLYIVLDRFETPSYELSLLGQQAASNFDDEIISEGSADA